MLKILSTHFSKIHINVNGLINTKIIDKSYKCFSTINNISNTFEPIRLNNLADNDGAIKRKKRLGRGIGSGRGKTCGRGHKGQKARSGGGAGPGPGFEGGQTPIYKRVPKRGFTNIHATPHTVVNLDKIQLFIDMKRINPNEKITIKTLVESGMVKSTKVKYGIKLLGKGSEFLTSKIDIEVSMASEGAIKAVEATGGSIKSVYYNRLGLRSILKPEKFSILPTLAQPKPKALKYYTNYEKRGYLSAEIQAQNLVKNLHKSKEGE